jgi:CRISPR/Cas system-associated protein endoribonuclease Cas2
MGTREQCYRKSPNSCLYYILLLNFDMPNKKAKQRKMLKKKRREALKKSKRAKKIARKKKY